MKIVLDTNVLISGIFFSGPPAQILRSWRSGAVSLVFSEAILDEYRRVAEELSAKFPPVDLDQIFELLTIYGEIHDPDEIELSVCEDPDDDKFIECAIFAQCPMIVSGDKHLLRVSGYRNIKVLKPRDFVDQYLD